MAEPATKTVPQETLKSATQTLRSPHLQKYQYTKENPRPGPGIPKGTILGPKTSTLVRMALPELLKALEKIGKKKKKNFFEFLTERAYESDPIAMKLIDKLMPNAGGDVRNPFEQPGQIILIRTETVHVGNGSSDKPEPDSNQAQEVPRRFSLQRA